MKEDRTIQGLSTIAMLKATFDAGKDHIDMFYPFVADSIKLLEEEHFGLQEVQQALIRYHGLSVPEHSIRILLSRGIRRGHIRREAGRYFRHQSINSFPDISTGVSKATRDNEVVAAALVEYATTRNFTFVDYKDALENLIAFLAENHVAVLSSDAIETASDDASGTDRAMRIVAGFLDANMSPDSPLYGKIAQLIEGFVLQNTLMLADISLVARRFKDLTVFLDTRCILGAIGLEGEVIARASREGLMLLRSTGARLAVFEATLNEIYRILDLYAHRIGTKDGRESLYSTPLSRYLLTNRFSPADVKQAQAMLETNVRSLQISIREFPARIRDLVLDEDRLIEMLTRPNEVPTEPRILHDVNCVAAMLTLRKGGRPNSLDAAKAVFCTTNGRLVATINNWFREQEQSGVLPIIHQLRLTNIAWNKKPAAAPNLKTYELAALCAVALRPSRDTWNRFLAYLKKLEESGELTSDEAIAVVASQFTDRYLGSLEEVEDDIDSDSLSEVVERVKQKYRVDADSRVLAAQEVSGQSEEARRQMELKIRGRVATIARIAARVVFWTLNLIVITASCLALPGVIGQLGPYGSVLGWGAVTVLAILTSLNLIKGWFLDSVRKRFVIWLESVLAKWMLADEGVASSE